MLLYSVATMLICNVSLFFISPMMLKLRKKNRRHRPSIISLSSENSNIFDHTKKHILAESTNTDLHLQSEFRL